MPNERSRRLELLSSGVAPFLSGTPFGAGFNPLETVDGPGEASSLIIEEILRKAGANSVDAASEVQRAVPEVLQNNPATEEVLQEGAAMSGAGNVRFKDLSGREKLGFVLRALGSALAVAASNDPGAALIRQIEQMNTQKQILEARRQRARERKEDREFAREQFSNEVAAQRALEAERAERRAKELREQREFDLKRDMQKFLREVGFRRAETAADREFQRQQSQSLRAEQRQDKRRAEIAELTLKLAPQLVSVGEDETGVSNPLGRAQRIATAIVDGNVDSLDDFDAAAFEFAVRKNQAVSEEEQRAALINAATRLVGKPQPVPLTQPRVDAEGSPVLDENGNPVFDVVRDPATGRVVPKTDALGNVLTVPLSMEEALTIVANGLEQHEFFKNRQLDPEAVAVAERASSLVVDPAKIKPEHLLDSGGNIGLLRAIIGDIENTPPEEQEDLINQFEEEMQARGFGKFSPEVRKAIRAHLRAVESSRKKIEDKLRSIESIAGSK